MLVKVIKETTITKQEVFFVQSTDAQSATEFIESTPWITGYTRTTEPKSKVYGLEFNTEDWAIIELQPVNGTAPITVYSPSLEVEDIEQAILEQNPDVATALVRTETAFAALSDLHQELEYNLVVVRQPMQEPKALSNSQIQKVSEFLASLDNNTKDELTPGEMAQQWKAMVNDMGITSEHIKSSLDNNG